MSRNAGESESPWARYVPISSWIRTYDRTWLRPDLIAGIVVAALIIPKNLGYADIAGVPLQNGLYAAAAGAILYAIFGTSRQISTGPSSGPAAIAAGAVAAAGITGIGEVATFVAMVTLMSGVIYLILSVLRMGWIARFLSRAVVTGFLFGAGIDVAIGELPKLTGTEVSGSNALTELWSWLRSLGEAHAPTLVVGAISLAVVFGMRLVAPKIPGALVLLVGGLVASSAFDLSARGVALVGEIPSGLPSFEVPEPALFLDQGGIIAVAAAALVLIGFSQTAGDARHFASRHRYQIDIDQESLAQGVANVGAGLFQGMPVTTSLSASSLNDRSGARTGISSLISGVIVLLTLVFLAPLFANLPKPVLAALIIEAVLIGMVDVTEMRRLRRVRRLDFLIAVAAIAATLLVGVLAGVVTGVVLSLIWLVAVTTRPEMPLLGRDQATGTYRELDEDQTRDAVPGVIILRLDGGLFFATAEAFDERIREVIAGHPDARALVVNCEGVHFIDSQGSSKVRDLVELAEIEDLELRFARLRPAVTEVLDRDGVLQSIGPVRTHETVASAVASV